MPLDSGQRHGRCSFDGRLKGEKASLDQAGGESKSIVCGGRAPLAMESRTQRLATCLTAGKELRADQPRRGRQPIIDYTSERPIFGVAGWVGSRPKLDRWRGIFGV